MTQTMTDLFEIQETLPENVRTILDKFNDMDASSINCQLMEAELNPLGYSFDWGLDGTPFDLQFKMPNKTIADFTKIVNAAKVESGVDKEPNEIVENQDGTEIEMCNGYAWNKIELVGGGHIVKVAYYEHPIYKPSQVDCETYSSDNVWDIEFPYEVIDEDGDELTDGLIQELLGEIDHPINNIDPALGDDETENIDIDKNMTKETITVERDNDRNLKFVGETLAHVSSKTADKSDRWTELTLYKTTSGKRICSQIGYTIWEKEHSRYKGAVCITNDEVIEFFGMGWLAKELYDQAEIDTDETID